MTSATTRQPEGTSKSQSMFKLATVHIALMVYPGRRFLVFIWDGSIFYYLSLSLPYFVVVLRHTCKHVRLALVGF